MNLIIYFIISSLLISTSCKTSNEVLVGALQIDTTAISNCNKIFVGSDQNSFYEENVVYDNIASESEYLWEFSNYNEAKIDSVIFLQGEKELANHSTMNSFLLIRNNKVVYEKYFHGSNKYESNNIHSASKCIISALVGIAIDKGYIVDVNQPILEYFPSFSPTENKKNDITIEHLLNMTSGFQWFENKSEYEIECKSNWINAILNLPLKTNPGTSFNYSSANTHLLSAILKNSVEEPCEFLYNYLMNDISVVVEHWGKDPQGIPSGGYNFYLTPREMAQFGLLYLNKGRYSNKQIIPENWVAASLSSQIKNVDVNYDYSNCWWITNISGYNVYKAWGYGGQYICLIPEFDLLIVSTATTSLEEYKEFDLDDFIDSYIIPSIKMY